MKMTMEKYFELVKEDEAKREALQEEIDELFAKADSLKAAMAVAGSEGDGEKYVELKAEWIKVNGILNVKREYLKNLPRSTTENDALEAWCGYAEKHNSKLHKALAEFESERAKLCKMYSSLVDIQNEALLMRERMAETSSTEKEKFTIDYIPVHGGIDKGLLRLGGFNCMDADACYYLANYCRENDKYITTSTGELDPEAQRISSVVVVHNSK
jgi:hypothetical protein